MRVVGWNATKFNGEIAKGSMDRLRRAAEVVADEARRRCPVGTISRPVYRTGRYAGMPWTARDAGSLQRSIRVVEKHGSDRDLVGEKNVRVYAGSKVVYYAPIVEYDPDLKFLRPALSAVKPQIKVIIEGG